MLHSHLEVCAGITRALRTEPTEPLVQPVDPSEKFHGHFVIFAREHIAVALRARRTNQFRFEWSFGEIVTAPGIVAVESPSFGGIIVDDFLRHRKLLLFDPCKIEAVVIETGHVIDTDHHRLLRIVGYLAG